LFRSKYFKGLTLDIPLDKLESEIENEVKNRLALIGIDLIGLKVWYGEVGRIGSGTENN